MIGFVMAKKDQKYYPTQRENLFQQISGTGMGILQVNKALSANNRRLYRQNRVYSVKVDAVGIESQMFDVYKLRDTFMLQRGYELAMREWNESYENAEEVTKERNIARWRDFRIETIPTVGDTEYLPQTLTSSGQFPRLTDSTVDEWETSLSYTTAGAGRSFGLYSDANTFGIVEEYDKIGKVQTDPSSLTSEAAYEELKSDLSDSEVARLQTEGNNPPYDADSSTPTSMLEYVGTVFVDSAKGYEKRSTGFFDAPLGVVFVSGTAGKVVSIREPSDVNVQPSMFKVVAQKGDYKGVRAHEYVDVTNME